MNLYEQLKDFHTIPFIVDINRLIPQRDAL